MGRKKVGKKVGGDCFSVRQGEGGRITEVARVGNGVEENKG